ncbi:M90 family metallopeptidase [Variovorax sp. PCZ-1]|uniref:M90 family metallopeptidase n=1 Tax=Variovorax sp. PCZ-1 TaxID=2835533 RepID=UPI001BCBF7F5|nr:M90 family metallopeptidase [Variovorax sp. PCZ-1]MBS7807697.1 zinc-dependent peptidase [Variovorax sp. PCZ-1]
MIIAWWQSWQERRRKARTAATIQRHAIDDQLWRNCLTALPFLEQRSALELARLRELCSFFLGSKEFTGAQGLEITDAHATMVAVQACVPILHIAPVDRPDLALTWYDSFVGIVLHPGEVRARREWVDEDGIVHSGSERLTGEVMEGGPLMLAWSDVQAAGELASQAYNVVIHEFIHVMDMRDGQADGCPPMPRDKRRLWLTALQAEYLRFKEASDAWQRFGRITGQAEPLLDPYGTESLDEFFAVAAEAYFVQRTRFAQLHPELLSLFDGFFSKSAEKLNQSSSADQS